MKMNALVDGPCIRALYRASHSRCARRPERSRDLLPATRACRGSPRTSASSRSWGACSSTPASTPSSARARHTIYIASADLMPRNLDHRVEMAVPIEAPELQAELLDTLERAFTDNQNAWELDGEGRLAAAASWPLGSSPAPCSSS